MFVNLFTEKPIKFPVKYSEEDMKANGHPFYMN